MPYGAPVQQYKPNKQTSFFCFVSKSNSFVPTVKIHYHSFLLCRLCLCLLQLFAEHFLLSAPCTQRVSYFLSVFINALAACTSELIKFYVLCLSKSAVWWEMASAAAARHWRGCHTLYWWQCNWNPIIGAPCWHFHQWKNPNRKICQKGNNSASKFNNINSPGLMKCMLFAPKKSIQQCVNSKAGTVKFNEWLSKHSPDICFQQHHIVLQFIAACKETGLTSCIINSR